MPCCALLLAHHPHHLLLSNPQTLVVFDLIFILMKWLWFTFTYFIKIIKRTTYNWMGQKYEIIQFSFKNWFNENSINHKTRKKTHVKLKVPWIQLATKSTRSKQKLSFELNGICNPKPHEINKIMNPLWVFTNWFVCVFWIQSNKFHYQKFQP
jgi:hypothetical protein